MEKNVLAKSKKNDSSKPIWRRGQTMDLTKEHGFYQLRLQRIFSLEGEKEGTRSGSLLIAAFHTLETGN